MLDIVDEVINGVLIFCGFIWKPLGEDCVFEISDIALEARFLWGVEVTIPVPGLYLAGASPSILIHLGFVHHGEVFTLFHNNVETTAFP